jgi:hypothetical protein
MAQYIILCPFLRKQYTIKYQILRRIFSIMGTNRIVTRFPPSPTGYLHIGGARTALFNWLFARKNHGKFILRIEDTDKARSTKEAVNAIIESMEWLGLDWGEGPYFQSQRYDIYNSTIDRLLSTGKAYYCHCSPEELEQKRKEAIRKGAKPKYDGKCRELGLGPAPGAVVRIKTPQTGITEFKDLVKGPIRFNNSELDDLVLKRSDGSPTYHLAVVSDDISLGINYVIRGDDHVNNTPRQILIYQALGEPLPVYAHVPMILGPDRTRLSKRHGAMSVLAYRDMGYLPQALLNSLARLGWPYGDQEKFTKEEQQIVRPVDNVTYFSDGFKKLNRLLSIFGKPSYRFQVKTIENMTSAKGAMPSDSRGFIRTPLIRYMSNLKLVAYEPIFNKFETQTTGFVYFPEMKKSMPHLVINGGVTQFDKGIISESNNFDLDTEFGGGRGDTDLRFDNDRSDDLSTIALDLNIFKYQDRTYLSGVATQNKIEIHRKRKKNRFGMFLNGSGIGYSKYTTLQQSKNLESRIYSLYAH